LPHSKAAGEFFLRNSSAGTGVAKGTKKLRIFWCVGGLLHLPSALRGAEMYRVIGNSPKTTISRLGEILVGSPDWISSSVGALVDPILAHALWATSRIFPLGLHLDRRGADNSVGSAFWREGIPQ